MSTSRISQADSNLRERIALVVSSGIVLFSVCYWFTQIVGAIRMLRLAYG